MLRPPTPHQLERIEQDELAKRSVARPRSAQSTAPAQRSAQPTASAQHSTRSATKKRRADQQSRRSPQPRRSPHESEEEDNSVANSSDSEDAAALEETDEDAEDTGNTAGSEEAASSGDEGDDDDDQGGTRALPSLVQVCDSPVFTPPMQEFHDDWASWDLYKKDYSRCTFQVLSVKYTVKAQKRNGQNDGLATAQPHIPLDRSPYERIYICTHGSPPRVRKKKPKKKRRPFRRINLTGCPFMFRVQNVQDEQGNWRLAVKMSTNYHTHSVGPVVYSAYPVARGIQDPASLQRASNMVADKARPNAIYDMLLEEGENVNKRDVENFIASHKTRLGRRDDNEATARLLDDLMVQDPDAVITVDETPLMETDVISTTTKHMREMFERFGEMILVDCTHKTNK
jgi:hypothetical protein